MNDLLFKQKSLLRLIAHRTKDTFKHNPSDCGVITKGEAVNYIKEHLLYMVEEVNELILAISDNDRAILKPWSTRYNEVAMRNFSTTDAIQEEAIDMLCFCMNICLAAGLTPENINAAYEKKWLENINRQERGY